MHLCSRKGLAAQEQQRSVPEKRSMSQALPQSKLDPVPVVDFRHGFISNGLGPLLFQHRQQTVTGDEIAEVQIHSVVVELVAGALL